MSWPFSLPRGHHGRRTAPREVITPGDMVAPRATAASRDISAVRATNTLPAAWHCWAIAMAVSAVVATASPLAAQVSVQGSTVHELDATPGAVRVGTIPITNTSPRPQLARIYLTDYIFFADGSSRFDPPGSLRRSSAGWIQLGAQDITIPPGATVPVQYTVRVPGNDSLAGSYWSVIMVESAAAPTTVTGGIGLAANVRYAVQVVTHLANSGARRLTIRSGRLGPDEGRGPVLNLEVANTGERATKFAVTTELFDDQGVVRARLQQSRGLTYPGASLMHRVELGRLPAGTYRAVVVLDAGGGNLTGAQYTLRL